MAHDRPCFALQTETWLCNMCQRRRRFIATSGLWHVGRRSNGRFSGSKLQRRSSLDETESALKRVSPQARPRQWWPSLATNQTRSGGFQNKKRDAILFKTKPWRHFVWVDCSGVSFHHDTSYLVMSLWTSSFKLLKYYNLFEELGRHLLIWEREKKMAYLEEESHNACALKENEKKRILLFASDQQSCLSKLTWHVDENPHRAQWLS